jgi:hypothetical protein
MVVNMSLKIICRPFFGAVLICAVVAVRLYAAETNQVAMVPDDAVDAVVGILESCPAWSDPNTKGEEILAHLAQLSARETSVIRSGMDRFVTRHLSQKTYNIASMSKLFVLNRFLFAVPEKEKFAAPFFGGFEGVPYTQSEMNPMWPLSYGNGGHVRLSGRYSGYSGDNYRAVQEFDYFLKKYGRRKLTTAVPSVRK